MGVHSGRADLFDGAGRTGPAYATDGCIRTTDQMTNQILQTINNGDLLQRITVTH